jgi:hypothetical protein
MNWNDLYKPEFYVPLIFWILFGLFLVFLIGPIMRYVRRRRQ